jgi:hypothetical protein
MKMTAANLYSFRVKIAVIARRFLPKQSPVFKGIASLRNARNDHYKSTRNEYNAEEGVYGGKICCSTGAGRCANFTPMSCAGRKGDALTFFCASVA